MDKDKIFAFYEKSYFRDLDDINTVIARFPMLIAGVALIINAYVFLFKFDGFTSLNRVFIIIIMIAISVSMGMLLYALYKVFKIRSYEKVPQLYELEEYRIGLEQHEKELVRYNDENPDNYQKEISWNDEFRDFLIENFIERSKNNGKVIEDRKMWFHSSIKWIWINLCLCITIPIFTIVIKLWI